MSITVYIQKKTYKGVMNEHHRMSHPTIANLLTQFNTFTIPTEQLLPGFSIRIGHIGTAPIFVVDFVRDPLQAIDPAEIARGGTMIPLTEVYDEEEPPL